MKYLNHQAFSFGVIASKKVTNERVSTWNFECQSPELLQLKVYKNTNQPCLKQHHGHGVRCSRNWKMYEARNLKLVKHLVQE